MRHAFQRINFADLFGTKWKCSNCGLKAVNSRQAQQLEGLECF